ncbi:non-ribosomal peptide synthase/polyketide synthase [Hydrogenophaga sp. BPS33]|uniref:non-ribosomal peptide synthase/polyketide synthase n=1 Tax=Hydrogenophaga sp. BPS33 TaxID=2651974 RepID=UPI00131F4CA2|nr:non-ribosomal peptide synthase/polyketide synthase [Hydrogenophaga sp. BPS33]QHE85934.1 amino acid adenylation domain-containing protein [Hydrogenophaga sp. BPS33]
MIDSAGLGVLLPLTDNSGTETETLASMFATRCEQHPQRLAYAFVRDTLGLSESITHAELFEQVCQVADALVAQTRWGDRVLLVYPPGLDFVRAFWACVITGRIAIPVPAPDAARFKNSAPRLLTILKDASARLMMVGSELGETLTALQEMVAGEQRILCSSLDMLPRATAPGQLPADSQLVTPDTIAYLQYTSGSTSAPRGVILTHRNIVAQCHSGARAMGMTPQSRALTWLPHHHDYGLVLGLLWPFDTGISSYLMSSLTFLRRPLRWLEAIARFEITHTGGPNFAYAACVRARQQQPEWHADLSSLRSVSCGAEPIQLATMEAFAASFAPHGLSGTAIMPSYGMAETVLGITTTRMNQGCRARTLHVPSLENHQVVYVADGTSDSRAIVGCGVPFEGMELRIVDPHTQLALPSTSVGEIWVRGTSVGQGYWEQPQASQATFQACLADGEGPFLRTGDLGFLDDGEVFVTGRLKDLIIVRGRNLYPHDLEWTAQSTDTALRVGYGAAFSIEGPEGEEVALVQEVERREKSKDLGHVAVQIRKAIAETYELPLHAVVLVQAGSLPRTSSGKIRRKSCRQDYLEGRLQVLHRDEAMLVDVAEADDDHLPALASQLRQLTDPAAQRHALEQLLLNRVAHFTRRSQDELSLDASAIECGLDSLTSFRMLQSLEAILDCALPSSLMLAAPDLRSTATRIQGLLNEGSAQPSVLVRDALARREGLLALSTRQQRMWFWQELAPGTALYNIPISLRMEGPLDAALLQRCLMELIQRHEILRLRWVNVEGVQRQRVEPLEDWRMRHVLLDPHDEQAARRQLDAIATEEAAYAFDLLNEPAVRATLVTLTPQLHQLLWIFHHSVSDGWSIQLILDELSQLYAARAKGEDPQLAAAHLQYLDFAEWESRWLDSGVRERELGYWKNQLRDAPLCLELPTDHRRPVHQQFRGGRLDLHFTAAQHQALLQAAKASDTTLFMVLLAAWQVLMHRYSGQSTVVTASAIANRSRVEFDRVVGYFANTLPLRSDFAPGMTVAELLSQVKATSLGAFEHHHVPFEEVIEALDLPRDRSRMPLTQTFFVLQPREPAQYGMGDVVARRLPLGSTVAKFDLSLELQETDEGLRGWIEYDRDLFEHASIARLASHLANVQADLCAHPAKAIGHLEMLTPVERHTQLVEWNGTARALASDAPIHTLIEQRVREAPDHEAVVSGQQRISYKELNRRANRVAHQLRRLGVKPDVRVGICMERSVELVVAYLAVLKAGGAFVPLDPELPSERLAFLLHDTSAPVVLTQAHLKERLPASVGATPCQFLELPPDAGPATGPLEDDLDPVCVNAPDDLAYVIYTSGSTGQPRGVMVPHRALSNHALWQVDKLSMAPHDRLLQKTTISFDASISDFYHPLLAGSTIVMAEPGMHRDTGYLIRAIRDERITQLVLVPSQLQALLDDPDFANCRDLRWVCSGGEALSLELAQRFRLQLPHAILGNFYGPSEATIDTTLFEATGPLKDADTVPIGRPVANAQCYVLDACGELMPAGAVGELHIGGAGLARGYLNRPDLTAALFVPHPFEQGQRVYRTGDLVRWLPDGQLEYIGRRDFQVKIRGVRMELGEIEAALKSLPGVRQAVVLVREDVADLKQLVAYVVGEQTDPPTLRQALRQQLPEAMVPSAIVPLPELPTLPNGKLDRAALPAPHATASQSGPAYEAPQGDVESRMAAIWSELLGVPHVGRHDTFFELGGHSLLVMRMVSLLRHAGYDLSVRDVFNTPTLSALASMAQPLQPVPDAPWVAKGVIPTGCMSIQPSMVPLCALTQAELDSLGARVPGGVANIQDIYPLAPLQEGILFHHQLDTEGDIYLTRVLIACDDADLQNRLVTSIQAVVDRHEALRTAVLWEGLSEPTQVVLRHAPLNVVQVDVPAGADALETLRAATDANRVRLDLSRAPLISVFVAQDPSQRRILVALLTHHLISDHVSIAVMLEEGLDILEGHTPPRVSSQPYRDFVALSRQTDLQAHQRYFERQLAGVSEPTAPFGVLSVSADQREAGVAGLALDHTLAALIRRAARVHGVSPAVLFHVAWALVVARCASVDDVVFGTVLSGRLQGTTGLERTVGLFINTLPVRVPLAGQSVKDAVQATYQRLIELVEHEHASLALAQHCSAVPTTLPLFNNILNYRHGRADMHVTSSGAHLPRLPAGLKMLGAQERTHYPMGISVDDLADGFALEAQAVGGIDAQKLAQYLAHAVEQLAHALEQEPEKPVLALEIISPEEQHALWLAGNANAKAYPLDEPVHRLIERRAGASAQHEALAFGPQRLSFAELNAQANRLAHHLRTLGVGPDVRVAVCMERSIELGVAILAVMKAGGAFVPMDPELPSERLGFMLADTAAPLMLTQSHLLQRLPAPDGAQRLSLDTLLPTLPEVDAHDPPAASGPDDLAYVIYTSGSTGQPKGVMVTHRSLCNLLHWTQETVQMVPGDRMLQVITISFDPAIVDLLLPLMAGATAVLAAVGEQRDAAALARTLRDERITHVSLVPSHLGVLLEEPPLAQCSALRHVICGGEALPWALVRQFQQCLPQATLGNFYGPTETTVTAAHGLPLEHDDDTAATVPIGRPIANTQCFVLDARMQPVPMGVIGELYIGGAGLARGYLNRADLTAERFLPHPIEAHQRLYRTGDLVRRLRDGRLVYLGRADSQVKVRGIRMELGEIEAALLELPAVRQAVATVREDTPGLKRLVAYVVGHDIDLDALKSALARRLPEAMVPSTIVTLPQLPSLPNGKIDRAALPVPDATTAQSGPVYEAPVGDVESRMAAIWSELLGVPRVGRHDSFFELGGHSLLVMRMVGLVRQAGFDVTVRAVFNNPTLAALASASPRLQAQAVPMQSDTAPRIPPGCTVIEPDMLPLVDLTREELDTISAHMPGGACNIQDIYPLAPLQEGILFHHRMDTKGDIYLSRALLSCEDATLPARFVAALQAAVDRHEALRTAIFWDGLGTPVQVVLRQAKLNVATVDVPPGADALQTLRADTDPEHTRLDLTQAPLLSIRVAQDPQNHRVLMAVLAHHIVSDHVSLAVMMEEGIEFLEGRQPPPKSAHAYRDFVALSRQGADASHARYFQQQLGDVTEPTTAFGVMPSPTGNGPLNTMGVSLEPALAGRLRHLARVQGFSPAVLFHAAWALVLARCSGSDDVVFGTVLSGRLEGTVSMERTVGLFINTLPLRVPLKASVHGLVHSVNARLRELIEHEHASLVLAQRCSGVAPATPLFNSTLNFRHSRADMRVSPDIANPSHLGGSRWPEGLQMLGAEERTNYPLGIAVDDLGEAFALEAQAVGGIDAQKLAQYLAHAVEQLAHALEQEPEKPVLALEIVSPEEQHALWLAGNANAKAYPLDEPVHRLIERRAGASAQHEALAFGPQRLSFAELNAQANRLAHHLRTLGVGPDVRVAVCMERSIELGVAILAVMKAGGAFVPMDPGLPSERLGFMLADTAAPLMLTQSHLLQRLPAPDGAQRLSLDTLLPTLPEVDAHDPPAASGPNDLAYVIYTSGSTGQPKGVMVTHRSLCNLLHWTQETVQMVPGDRMLQVITISFDPAIVDLLLPLMAGATAVLAAVGEQRDAAALARTLRDERITHVSLVPSHLGVLLEEPPLAQCSALRHVICGGEALPWALVRQFQQCLPQATLGNFYGPTETTVTAAHGLPLEHDDDTAATVPIGRPIANTQCFVLDARMQPVPMGVIGELYIGGAGLARGYLNRADLTAERFLPHPIEAHQRLYRTGDLVRRLRDGRLVYLGRADSQVKVRGIRMELGEIEAALLELPAVRQAVATVREDTPGLKRLVAYVVGHDIDLDALKSALARRLPEAMVPSTIVTLPQLPSLPNGKIDRAALPVPEQSATGHDSAFVAPRNATEQTLWAIWAELLQHSQFGVHENFFELGGHSLLAMQVLSRVRKQLGHEVPLRTLFDAPSVAAFAQALGHTVDGLQVAGIPRAPAGTVSVLTAAQQGMWFAQKLDGDSAQYNIPLATRLRGPIDVAALERSLQVLCERHALLHSHVVESDGVPMLQEVSEARWPLHRVDLPASGAQQLGKALQHELDALAHERIDLALAPLARATLVQISEQDHVLLLVVHHLACDGWSLDILLRELATEYGTQHRRAPTELPATALQWRDVALWEQARAQSGALSNSMDYWRGQLHDLQPLRLPLELDRADAQKADEATLDALTLPAPLVRHIESLAARHNASVFMVLLAAFKLVLMRRSGQQDVAVGMPVVGRDSPELEPIVGPLLNTVVLRSQFHGLRNFADLLQHVRSNMLDAWSHQDVPFDRLVAELAPQRELDRTPFFDVLVNAAGRWDGHLKLDGLATETLPLRSAAPKFALTLYMQALPGQVHMGVTYRTDRLCASAVGHLLDQFCVVLQQAATEPERPLADFSLLSPQGQALLADPSVPLEPGPFTPVIDRVLAHVARQPAEVAVQFAQRSYTYAELEASSRHIAHRMRGAGVMAGDVVAISGARSVAVVASMLAALMQGAVFVMVDPAMPLQRKQSMLRECKPRLICLIGDAAHDAQDYDAIDMEGMLVLRPQLDDILAAHAEPVPAFPCARVGADDPAYIFFTSGSTGVPKAVLGRHRGLSHFIEWQRERFDITPHDRVSQLVGLSFDPVLRDILLPLTSGATLCIPQDRDLLDPLAWMGRESITVAHTTPSVMQVWLRGTRLQQPLHAMRWLFAAGEPLLDSLVNGWRTRCGTAGRIVNLYGPTETTMARCFHVVDEVPSSGIQPVGLALPDSQVLVLTPSGQRCGVGESGEVVLRTPMRSLGYLNRPEENQQRFRQNPWRDGAAGTELPPDALYFTGDRGRVRHDGSLEIAGRLDDQVKIRGVRVEPAEVAAVLARHASVQQCAVVPGSDKDGQPMLVAYVVTKPGLQTTARELRADLARQLPEAYLPAATVFLPALPMQANGKVDRRKLPAPGDLQTPAQEDRVIVMPRGPLEQTLWDIWRLVLRAESFGVYENFFELGGHSLLATQVVARIRDVMGVELPLRVLFESPRIADLAAAVDAHLHQASGGHAPALPVVARVSRDELLPTSYSQRRMWLVQQFNPETTAYNMPFAVRLRGALDTAALVESLHRLTERHEAFRTTLVSVDGEPMQRIGPVERVPVQRVNLMHLPASERDSAAAAMLREFSSRTYDLAQGPLHRPTLLQLDEQDHVLYWSVHHAIGDGWSTGILMKELSLIYSAVLRGREPALAPLLIDFADYASWQRQALNSEALGDQLNYWKQTLKGLEPLPLPIDRRRQGLDKGQGARATGTFAPQTLAAIRQVAAEHNATPFMLLLACFQLTLGRYCGVKDVAVGTPIANRTQVHAEHLVGTLVNTIVMRTAFADDLTFVELLERVRETALEAYAHQDLPFEALVEAVGVKRTTDTAPLVQVLFNVLTATQPAQAVEGIVYDFFKFDSGSTQFDLALGVDTHAHGRASLSYSTEVFEPATGERLLRSFMAIVESAVADPHQRLSAIDLVSDEDHQRLLAWNDTTVPTGPAHRVHDLIARQAARTPTAVALEQTGLGGIDYAELEARSNRLAHALRERGIGRGALVGLCVERSIDMVVAQLAILKAGAAYVPLDPAYPSDRLAYMAEDAQLALLVTESALVHALQWPRDRSLLLDVDIAIIAAQPDSPLEAADERDAGPGDPAYVIYTSGSTGKPKGVVVHHQAVVNFLSSMAREPGLSAADTLVAVTTLSFDIAVLELLLPLSVGARVLLASRDQALNGEALRQLIESNHANVMQATPSTWRILIESGWQGSPNFKALIGGEGLPQDLAELLLARTGELWNMYGPTETTVWSTCWKVTQPEQGIFIGSPIANTTIHILDEQQKPCPIGVPGEIYIGGQGVTLGYLHREELTAERFIPDPFQPGARLYRTGDRGRWRNNGLLEHQGRLDFQVKVRGYRIELGEIESQLASHPQVARTVVIVREDVPGDVRLVAYVVPHAEMPAVQALRDHLRASLPDYMVPQHFIELPSIPLLPNGKINRHELPVPSQGSTAHAEDLVLPRTPAEQAVAQVWQRLLGLAQVGVNDNFFDLGGHSLLAMRAINELHQRHGAVLTVRQLIFDNLGQIAATLKDVPHASEADLDEKPREGWLGKLMDRIR